MLGPGNLGEGEETMANVNKRVGQVTWSNWCAMVPSTGSYLFFVNKVHT